MQKLLLLLGLLFSTSICTFAQQDEEKRLVSLGQDFFVPHWFMSLHAGAAYDVGEAKFSKLLSPGAQASLGYHFTPLFATRLSIGGWEARNRYAYPSEKYKWNFIQPAVDAMVDITTLIDGWEPERFFHLYAFAGVGLNISFNNDDAVNASARMANSYKLRELVQLTPNYFEKLWEDSRLNPVVRAGIGADFHITDNVALGAEVNANMLPDHFNSKLGKHDNRDWHFNAMVGVKFIIGKSHGRTDPTYQTVHKPVEPKEPKFVDVPVEKISFNVNIYFTDPAAEGWESLNKHFPAGVQITKTPGQTHVASAKLVRDREAWGMGYQGILNRGEGTWPIIKPEMVTELDKHYNALTLEFENMYRAADDIQRKTKQNLEIYAVAATEIKAVLDAFVAGTQQDEIVD